MYSNKIKNLNNITNTLNPYNDKISKVDITLGCDPEFFLIDKYTKKLLHAYMFFNRWDQVGSDGILAELRPHYSLTPFGLVYNLYKLIISTRDILNRNYKYNSDNIMMLAASNYKKAVAGFHLHFGLPKVILGKNLRNTVLMYNIVKILDYYIGLPASILEGEVDAMRRSNIFISYGKPSDFRLDNRTLEYRVVGGNMLKHPVLSIGLIALGNIVIQDIISKLKWNSNNFTKLYLLNYNTYFKDLYPDVLNTSSVYSLICSPCTRNARVYLDNVYTGIQQMIGYREKSGDIDRFFNCIFNNIQYNNDMEYNWREFYNGANKFC